MAVMIQSAVVVFAAVTAGASGGITPPGFALGWSIPLEQGMRDAQIADMNDDGRSDLVILTEHAFSRGLFSHPVVFTSLANGGFAPHETESIFDTSSKNVGIADFDGDGVLDVMETQHLQEVGDVIVRLGLGDGALGEGVSYGLTFQFGYWEDMELGDFDGDGDVDAVVVGAFGFGVPSLLNDGKGAFTNGPVSPITATGFMLASGHVDSDGVLDLIALISGKAHIMDGVGDASFALESPGFSMGMGVEDLVLADLDGGHADLIAAANGAVMVRKNYGGGFFPELVLPTSIPVGGHTKSLDVGHIDSNGHPDIVVETDGDAVLVLNLGGMEFSPALPLPGPGRPLLGDADADGDLDLFLVTEAAASVYLNDTIVPPAGPDLDGSGFVDSADLNLVLGSFGCVGGACAGDTDADGDVDSVDLNAVLAAFGTSV